MIKLLFVCHGNICRSPMAESVCAYEIQRRKLSGVSCDSAAARHDEIGNPPYPRAREKLEEKGIPLVPHRARVLIHSDEARYDYFLGMDDFNVRDMKRILGNPSKPVKRLLDYTACPRSVADPWYTGDFERAYLDIVEGVGALLDYLENEGLVQRGEA